MKKSILILFLVIAICLAIPCIALAHSGRTDGDGGHTDHSTGEYHWHHGYSAHQHYDMDGDGVVDCPYNFVDATDHSPGSSSSSSRYSNPTPTPQVITETVEVYVDKPYVPKSLIVWICFVILFLVATLVLTIKSKNNRISKLETDIRKAEKETADLKQQMELEKKKHSKALFQAEVEFKKRILYLLTCAPDNAYVTQEGLPFTNDSETEKWGTTYTYYVSWSNRSTKYHAHYCQHAHVPINAYTLINKQYTPCSVCRPPALPNMEWVDKYNILSEFLRINGFKYN